MSDEQEVPNEDDLVRMLNNEPFLKENGYRLTPKGIMALVMMANGCPNFAAEVLAQTMSDRIFAAGFTYVDEQTLGIELFGGDNGEG